MRAFPLPFAIIHEIIENSIDDYDDLLACALVSKDFHRATLPSLYREPMLETLTDLHLLAFHLTERCGKWIFRLDLRNPHIAKGLTDVMLATLIQHTKNLREFRMSLNQCYLTDAGIEMLTASCRYLTHISFGSGPGSQKALTGQSIAFLMERCSMLRELDLFDYNPTKGVQPNFKRIAVAWPRLERLDLSLCEWVSDAIVDDIVRLTNLKSLLLLACRNITSSGVQHIAATMPQLRYLCLHDVTEISEEALVEVCQCLRKLKRLDVSYNDNLAHHFVNAVASFLPELRVLTVINCKNLQVAWVRDVLKGIEVVDRATEDDEESDFD